MSQAAAPSAREGGNESRSWLTIPRELLYVDFLGVLVPGLFTVLLGATMIALTSMTAGEVAFGAGAKVVGVGDLFTFLEGSHYELGVATFVSAYIIGTALFRQDTKHPDFLSALQVWLSAAQDERRGLAAEMERHAPGTRKAELENEIDRKSFAIYTRFGFWPAYWYLYRQNRLKDFDAQFPYRYMRCYLAARGLAHLSEYVPWCPRCAGTTNHRTKMFINILKIRLADLAPNFGRDIVRNEAHVRLATSVWYASTTLMALVLVCAFVLGAAVAYGHFQHHVTILSEPLYNTIAVLVIVLALGWLMHHQLRKCIHYMRVREVVYVLEATHLATTLAPPKFKIDDLRDRVTLKDCRDCDR
jgi:hypothetical protein